MAIRRRKRIDWFYRASLGCLLILLGLLTNSDSIIWVKSLIFNQNHITDYVTVEEGFDFLKYTSTTSDSLEDNLTWIDTISSDNIVNDLEVDGVGDIVLNHRGQIAPDIINDGLWWDDDGSAATDYNWEYRQCWDINTTDTGPRHLYLDIDTTGLIASGNMNSDGSDIRFVDFDGNNIIEHYLTEGINTTSTRIWIKPTLPLLNNSICMYYGNPTATSTSSRDIFNNSSEYYNLQEAATNSVYGLVSYTDNNIINTGSLLGPFSAYEPTVTSTSLPPSTQMEQALYLESDAPVYPLYTTNGTEAFTPAAFAGTQFVYPMTRSTNNFSFIATQCSATVDFYVENSNTEILLSSFTVQTNMGFNLNTNNNAVTDPTPGIPNNSAIMIEVTNGCPILAYHSGSGNDSQIIHPEATEWLGVGTNSAEIAASVDGTVITAIASDGNISNFALDRGQIANYNRPGNQGTDASSYITSNFPVGVRSLADGDGNEATTYLPPKELGNKFIVGEDAQYAAFASLPEMDISIQQYDPGCTTPVGGPQSVIGSNIPGKIFYGSSTNGVNITQGTCFIADGPVFGIFERSGNNDETNLWSQTQNRVQTEETVTFGVVETGTWNLGTADTWQNRVPVSIANIAGFEQTAFIEFDTVSDIFLNGQAQGADLRFAGIVGDGTDTYEYALQRFDAVNDRGSLWVQIPNSTGTFDAYIYYNTINPVTDQSDRSEVFTYTNRKPTFALLDERGITQDDFRVYALEDAQIHLQDLDLGIFAHNFVDTSVDISYSPTSVIGFDQTIFTNGPIAGTAFNTDASDTLTPQAFAGTEFLLNAYRGNDRFVFKAVDATASVTIEESDGTGWSLVRTDTITTAASVIVENIGNGTSIRIASDQPIYASHVADTSDSKVLYPTDLTFQENNNEYEINGIGSNNYVITASQDDTDITIYDSNGATAINQTITAGANYFFEVGGGGTQGTGRGLRITADKPISGNSFADSDGSESTSFWSPRELDTIYAIPHPSQYISVVARSAGVVCTIFDENNAFVESKTSTTDPGFLHFGGTLTSDGVFYNPGARVECDKPVFAYIEKHDPSNPSVVTDETNNLNITHARYPILGNTTWTDLDDPSIQEQGLHVNGGSLIGLVDITGQTNADHVWWGFVDELINTPAGTQVNIEFQESCINPGATGWQTYTQNIPANISDQPCLAFRITLTSTDRQYTPFVDDFDIVYSLPDQDNDFNSNIFIAQQTTNVRRRMWKVIPRTDFIGTQSNLVWEDSGGTFDDTQLNLRRLDSYTSTNQFTLPPIPSYGSEGISISIPAEGLSIEADYSQTSSANYSFNLESQIPSTVNSALSHNFNVVIP